MTEDDPFCEKDNIWPVAKSGYVAKMRCKNGVGERSRSCDNSIWGLESSSCVNVDLHDILLDAQVSYKPSVISTYISYPYCFTKICSDISQLIEL